MQLTCIINIHFKQTNGQLTLTEWTD